MTRSLRLWLWYCSAVLAVGITLATGLITDWGEWYSSSLPYRKQTEALLDGRIALSHTPTALALDLAWANSGVQQVWGLGVPLWRLPFEALARLFGQPAFPGRLALALALTLFIYAVIRTFSTASRDIASWLKQFSRWPERLIAIILLALFPPVITLCRGPFNVYEEAVFYGYLYSIGLFFGLLAFWRRPRFPLFVALSLFAGLAIFVRPPLVGYGFATVLIATVLARRARWPWWKCLTGPGLFGLGGLLLLLSNWQRFGSGLEFGHNLNLTGIDLMYTSRIAAPFHEVSLWACVRELFGSLFLVRELNGFDMTCEHIVLGQSPLYRWRHFYETTFDLTFLVAILAAWTYAGWLAFRKSRNRFSKAEISLPLLTALWSLIAFIPLYLFYLRLFAISSRYMLDFAPAIAVAMVGGLHGLRLVRLSYFPKSHWFRWSLLGAFGIWLGWEIGAAQFYFPGTPVWTKAETLRALNRPPPPFEGLPAYYSLENGHRPSEDIYRNGAGWGDDGTTAPLMVLFVQDPGKIRLDVAPAPGVTLADQDYRTIRAKVGLEFLELESIENTSIGKRLTFSAPKRAAYRQGLQVLFLAFATPDQVSQKQTPFRLLKVSWIPGQ